MNLIENYMVVPVCTSFFDKSDGLYDWLREQNCCFVVDNTRNCFLIFNINGQLRKEMVETFHPHAWELHTQPNPPEVYVELFRHIDETIYRNILAYRVKDYDEPIQFITYSKLGETLEQGFFKNEKSDIRKILINGLEGIVLYHPDSFTAQLSMDVPSGKDLNRFENINSFALIPYRYNYEAMAAKLYLTAYAVDKEKEAIIVFNPSPEDIDKIYLLDGPVSIVYSEGIPPKRYTEVFKHVDRQMGINLSELYRTGKQRWQTTPLSEGAIRICQTKRLHGIDALTGNLLQ